MIFNLYFEGVLTENEMGVKNHNNIYITWQDVWESAE